MKNMQARTQLLPDAASHSSPKSQGYPDECKKSALTSKSLELMENRNYTVELWRASKITPAAVAGFRLVQLATAHLGSLEKAPPQPRRNKTWQSCPCH